MDVELQRRLSIEVEGSAGKGREGEASSSEAALHDVGFALKDDESDEAADLVQRWWRNLRSLTAAAKRINSELNALESLCQGISQLATVGFDAAQQMLMEEDGGIQAAAADVMAALPPDPALLRRPRCARSGRALLSAALMVAFPQDLLTDQGEEGTTLDSPEVRELSCAARLLVATVKALTTACQRAKQGGPGTIQALGVQLGALAFSRRFYADSFLRWRAADAERVAARLVQPYARAYATMQAAQAENDTSSTLAIQRQLDHYRTALERVIGKERASNALQEVEAAVEAEFADSGGVDLAVRRMSSFGAPEARGTAPSTSAGPAAASAVASAPAAASSAAAEPPSGAAAQLLGNARLAHELILTPDFQFGEPVTAAGGGGGGPTGEVEARLRDAMHRAFWDRVTLALLPPKDIVVAADVKQGMVVQARYGSATGAFYTAQVLAVRSQEQEEENEDGGGGGGGEGGEPLFDLRYQDDGAEEPNVPFSRLRTSADPIDIGPLSSVLAELRDKLAGMAPPDRAAGVRAKLDPEMLKQGPLNAVGVAGVVRAAVDAVLELQAPFRTEATRLWLLDFEEKAAAAAAAAGEGQGDARKAMAAAVALLPGAFEFVFAKCEEMKRDTANAHLRMLAPYLSFHGVEYERKNFEKLLQSGATTLDNTRAWLEAAVGESLERRRTAAPDVAAGAAAAAAAKEALVAGREETYKELLAEALVLLLQRPVRLDSSNAKLPETLAMDAGRLAAARDAYDRVAFTATMTVLFRQVLARMHIPCPPATLQSLRSRLNALMQLSGVSLPDLVAVALTAAKEVCGDQLAPDDEASLANLLKHSADANNEVFKVFFARVGVVIQGALLHGGAANLCLKAGLSGFEAEVLALTDGLRKLWKHNISVFAAYYSRIIKEAANAATQ